MYESGQGMVNSQLQLCYNIFHVFSRVFLVWESKNGMIIKRAEYLPKVQPQQTGAVLANICKKGEIDVRNHIETSKVAGFNTLQFIRWILLSTFTGLGIGFVAVAFNYDMTYANKLRTENPWLLLFLPFAGLAIVYLYKIFNYEKNKGTDEIVEGIQNPRYIPLRMSILIFISTILTVLCGGSVGREGAAVQIGGSLGKQLGERFNRLSDRFGQKYAFLKFNDQDKTLLLMSGVAAAFSALFGTPLAAAFLAMEMANVGIMYYPALVPCVWSSIVAYLLAVALKSPMDHLHIVGEVALELPFSLHTLLLSVLCALVSILFCTCVHHAKHKIADLIKNAYVRVFIGGVAVILLTILFQTDDYLGPGMNLIETALEGHVIPIAFLLKILFTAVTIGTGFKGGEIVPSFATGATFGVLYGSLTGANPSLCAALGMIAVFCGVTNCPVTALLIGLELFGFDHAGYFLIAVAVSYMMSGSVSLYHSQKIIHAKIEKLSLLSEEE